MSGSAPATTTCSPSAATPVHGQQLVGRFGQRVLLPREAGDEAAAERQAARLEPAQRPDHLAPGHLERLAAPQLPGDDAPATSSWCATTSASSSLPGERTPSATAGAPSTSGPGSSDQRPSPMPDPAGARRRARRFDGRRTVRVRQRSRAESRERTAEKASAVTRPRATRSHRPSSTSAGRRPVSRGQLGPEAGAPRAQRGQHVGPGAHLGLGCGRPGPHGAQHRDELVAHDEGQRRGGRRRARCARCGSARGVSRAPDHLAREAQLVEPARVVVADAGGQDLRLPLRGRRLDAGQLLEHLEQAGPALEPGRRRGVLPARQEAHVVARSAPPRPGRAGGAGRPRAAGPAGGGRTSARRAARSPRPCPRGGPARCAPAPRSSGAPRGAPARQRGVGHQLFDRHRPGQLQVPRRAGRGGLVVGAQRGRGRRGARSPPSSRRARRPGRRPPVRRTSRPMARAAGTPPATAGGRAARRGRVAPGRAARARRRRRRGRARPSRAAGTGRPSGPSSPRPRRRESARVRRSSSGASSR